MAYPQQQHGEQLEMPSTRPAAWNSLTNDSTTFDWTCDDVINMPPSSFFDTTLTLSLSAS
eukprot:CAMPEP_0170090624 /NCGR_PEP_ID=MMETSP0019_2-20121128/24439_1 /TAXON_ID=98059 /ORGANISM="Dinobryon sp., Strain UTEXLB2267" /LENGTH=59 /DNA_ID=CAMNT_0010310135 /DNA_START=43 /DNA_END=222 /DNA_ORIENTATION=+